jgi:hypothetical protein
MTNDVVRSFLIMIASWANAALPAETSFRQAPFPTRIG